MAQKENITMKFKKIRESEYEIVDVENLRILYDSSGEIVAIDPPGGPMYEIGHNFGEGKLLRNIYHENNKLIAIIN